MRGVGGGGSEQRRFSRGSGGRLGLEPAGPAAAGMAAAPSKQMSSMQLGSLVEFPGDHFSFGEIGGLGRAASQGGLLHHDYFNRGRGLHEEERERLHLPALVESGRHAGLSRVVYQGAGIGVHLLRRDFFITVLQTPFLAVAGWVAALYLWVFFFWGAVWFLVVRYYPGCLYGATTFVESWTFAIITQMTIGYGNTGPQRCWAAAWIILVQTITNLLMNAIILGIIFAKVANPKYRGRSIFISDSGVIARRDGILKFMFRVADVRRTQVIEPKVQAFLYTWGAGRVTAEGEKIPVRCEQLHLGYIDGMLLLPLIIEHTIDERSPLCGHTHDSLAAMNAEIVVTFEATTENGNPFYARQSYLAQEISWGCTFMEIIGKPAAEAENPRYSAQLDTFHDVRCPTGRAAENRSQASQLVVNRAKRAVPYPLLGENTLVLSDVLCVRPVDGGQEERMELVCRVADTYPNQMLEVTARMYLYRWRPLDWCRAHPDKKPFTLHQLQCGYSSGTDRLYLRLPVKVVHPIDSHSPLASWLGAGGLSDDADSEIVVVLQGYLYQTATNRMRQRTYRVGSHVRYGFNFAPVVRHPIESRDGKPRVRWAHFFEVEPVGWAQDGWGRPTLHLHTSALNNPAVQAYMNCMSTLAAPESHAQVRAQQDRNPLLNSALDRPLMRSPRWAAAAGAGGAAGAPDSSSSALSHRGGQGPAAERTAATPAAAGRQWEEAAGREGPQPAMAAAAAEAGLEAELSSEGVEAEGAGERAEEEAPPGVGPVRPSLQLVADVLGRDSTSTPSAAMDRYAPALARTSAVVAPQAAEAAAGTSAAAAAPDTAAHGAGGAAPAPAARTTAGGRSESKRQRHPASAQGVEGAAWVAPAGPPDLGMLSAGPAVPMDRYDTAVSRLSLEPAGTIFETEAGNGSSGGSSSSGSELSGGTSQPTGITSAPPTPPAAAQRAATRGASAGTEAAGMLLEPDLLPSDLTAQPSVPLERYAAMVSHVSELDSADAGWLAGVSTAAPEPLRVVHPEQVAAAGQGQQPHHHVRFAGQEAGAGDREGGARGHRSSTSWRKDRSLANLQAMFQEGEGGGGGGAS